MRFPLTLALLSLSPFATAAPQGFDGAWVHPVALDSEKPVTVDWDGDGGGEILAVLVCCGSALDPEPLLDRVAPFGWETVGTYALGNGVGLDRTVVVDVDGDGREDIVHAIGEAAAFEVALEWLQDGGPGIGFGAPSVLFSVGNRSWAESLVRADADGDGADDLFFTYGDFLAPTVRRGRWVYLGSAGGPSLGPESAPALGQNVGAMDVDRDGRADLLFVRTAIEWRRTEPGGTLAAPVAIGAPTEHVVVADGTGDMLPDLIAAANGDLELVLHAGLPAGGLGAPVLLDTAAVPITALGAFDVDGDGLDDLFVFRGTQGLWFPGSLAGFGAPRTIPPGPRVAMHVAPFDIDQDTDLDLLVWTENLGISARINDAVHGEGFCVETALNSTGALGAMYARGSASVLRNDLVLGASSLPPGEFGIFVTAAETASTELTPAAQTLCLGGTLGRFSRPREVVRASTQGVAELSIDLTALPAAATLGPVVAGDTRYFQHWSRDAAPSGFALSTALAVRFE